MELGGTGTQDRSHSMRFVMPNLSTRDDSSLLQFRMRVPSDVLSKARGRLLFIDLPAVGTDDAVTVAAKVGDVVKFSLRTRDLVAAKARHGVALSSVNRLFAGIRNGPKPLTLRQIVALSGDVYRLFLDECGDDPGSVNNWIALKAFNRAVREGRIVAPPALQPDPKRANECEIARQVFGIDLTEGVNGHPAGTPEVAALDARFGLLANWTLLRQGVEVGPDDRARLLYAVEKAVTDAAIVLKRHAQMDFTPAPEIGARFPSFEAPKPALPSITLTELIDRWRTEAQPSPRTLQNWQGVVRRLRAHVGHDDAGRINPEVIVSFKDALIADGTAARTFARVYLVCLNRLFGFAVDNRLIRDNPARGVKVSAKVKPGAAKLGYSVDDAMRLLRAAASETKPERKFGVSLLALTGARAGEVFQLHAEQVIERDGVPCIEIRGAADGGRIKTGSSERIVPIHPYLMEIGFVEWARGRAAGPLFYAPRKVEPDALHPSVGVGRKVGEWVRWKGFGSERVAALHGLRHFVKTELHRAGVADSTADALMGHVGKGEASTYRHISVATLAEAIAKLPLPRVDTTSAAA